MIDQVIIEHHIQKHILSVLMHTKFARFRDMRPPKVDTNLYSYHLKLLIKSGFVQKQMPDTLDKKNRLHRSGLYRDIERALAAKNRYHVGNPEFKR